MQEDQWGVNDKPTVASRVGIIDPILGKCKVLQATDSTDRFLQKIHSCHNEEERNKVDEWLRTRSSLAHPNVWGPDEYTFYSGSGLSQCCGGSSYFDIYFRAPDDNLDTLINKYAAIGGLPIDILNSLLHDSIHGMAALESIRSFHGYLGPRYVGIVSVQSERRFVIMEDFLNRELIIDQKFGRRKYYEFFPSPEAFELLFAGKPYSWEEMDLIKADVFSLGMVLLQSALGSGVNFCYDTSKGQFDSSLLSAYYSAVRQKKGPAIESFLNTVAQMLTLQPQRRPLFSDLVRFLANPQSSMNNQVGERRSYSIAPTSSIKAGSRTAETQIEVPRFSMSGKGVIQKEYMIDTPNSIPSPNMSPIKQPTYYMAETFERNPQGEVFVQIPFFPIAGKAHAVPVQSNQGAFIYDAMPPPPAYPAARNASFNPYHTIPASRTFL